MDKKSRRVTQNKMTRLNNARGLNTKLAASNKTSMKIFWLPSNTECLRRAELELELTGFA